MNIQAQQALIKTLMSELEGIEQGSADYSTKLDSIEAEQAKLTQLEADDKRHATLQKSLSSFSAPKSTQSNISSGAAIVKDPFTQDPKKGFSCAGELMAAIAMNTNGRSLNLQADPRLAHIADIMQTGGTHTTVNDGLMIPAELLPEIHTLGREASADWFSMISVNNTSLNAKEIRRTAATTRGGGGVGLISYWGAEGAQLTKSREVYEKTTVKVDKLYVYTEVTDEDLSDFAGLEGDLRTKAPELMRIKKQEAVLFGDGVAKPLGFSNGGDTSTISRGTADDVDADDVAQMNAAFLNPSGGFWMMNQQVRSKVQQFVVGTQPVWQNDFTVNANGMLFGKPIFNTEDCEALGDVGDVYLVNPSAYYALQKVGGDKFATSMHLRFDFDEHAFRWTTRFGGTSIYNSPYIPRQNNGGTTKQPLSNFVILGDA